MKTYYFGLVFSASCVKVLLKNEEEEEEHSLVARRTEGPSETQTQP